MVRIGPLEGLLEQNSISCPVGDRWDRCEIRARWKECSGEKASGGIKILFLPYVLSWVCYFLRNWRLWRTLGTVERS